MICWACCVIGCGEELVWIVYVLKSGGRFVGEMGLYPVKLASLPFLLLYNIALMLHVESDGQIVGCVLCLFSVLDGVSQSLEIGSDQFRFS